jgi:hypothetical protein
LTATGASRIMRRMLRMVRTTVVVALTVAASTATAVATPSTTVAAAGNGEERPVSGWRMHAIDGELRGANSLGRGDVNGDGLPDYSVNYEFDQRYVVYLHPGAGEDPRQPWPRVVLTPSRTLRGEGGVASESSALGDLDGDGNVDLVGAQSRDQLSIIGDQPGLHVFWGPDPERATDPGAWVDAGVIPATDGAGHYHWVVTRDVDRDGDLDLMVGGRVLVGTTDPTGILWIEAPDDPGARRDLAQWPVHEIDGDTWSGHGFAFADLDGDGDEDLVDATEDFDTPDDQEDVAWYENPGPGSAAQKGPWRRTQLYASPEFTIKPQIGVGDLDGDGDDDLVTQTPDHLVVFEKTGTNPVTFDVIEVPKPAAARWTPRTVRVADLDGDGRDEVIGFLSHENSVVPTTTASIFRMIPPEGALGPDGWTLAPVLWGPGGTMQAVQFGSKWDQADVTDVDGDGDLDIVANNEEWWLTPAGELASFDDPARVPSSSVSVVWLENRLDEAPTRCRERRGTCRFEAEDASAFESGTWVERPDADASGGLALVALNGLDPRASCRKEPAVCKGGGGGAEGVVWGAARGVRYDAVLAGGEYRLWARVKVPTTFSSSLGDERSDQAWVAVDGARRVLSGVDAPRDEWTWVPVGDRIALDRGRHSVELRVRDRGLAVDQLVLTTGERPPS